MTIYSSQILKMQQDVDRVNDESYVECKLISSCIQLLTCCLSSEIMLRDILDPKHLILKHMGW